VDFEPEHFYRDRRAQRVITYIVLSAIFLVLLLVALLTFKQGKANQQADAKADQLIAELGAQGLQAPSRDQLARTLGTDGGAVCQSPGGALTTGLQKIAAANGAAGPGMRPVDVANQVVEGERAIITVYCPEKSAEFENFVNSQTYADVIRD
jgi:hypothetical protein